MTTLLIELELIDLPLALAIKRLAWAIRWSVAVNHTSCGSPPPPTTSTMIFTTQGSEVPTSTPTTTATNFHLLYDHQHPAPPDAKQVMLGSYYTPHIRPVGDLIRIHLPLKADFSSLCFFIPQFAAMLSQGTPFVQYAEKLPWMAYPSQLDAFADAAATQPLTGKDVLRTVLASRGVTYEPEPKRSKPQQVLVTLSAR